MRTIHICVSHDDNFFVAQVLRPVGFARAAAQCLNEIGNLLICRQLGAAGIGHIENFTTQGQNSLILAAARLFGRATGTVTFDNENLRAKR